MVQWSSVPAEVLAPDSNRRCSQNARLPHDLNTLKRFYDRDCFCPWFWFRQLILVSHKWFRFQTEFVSRCREVSRSGEPQKTSTWFYVNIKSPDAYLNHPHLLSLQNWAGYLAGISFPGRFIDFIAELVARNTRASFGI